MKQKIIIEANIRCDKCRSKAMKIATVEDGVQSVAFKGPRRDQIEIIGEEVDAARLAKLLRKKLGYADLVSVEEITEKKLADVEEITEKKLADDKKHGDGRNEKEKDTSDGDSYSLIMERIRGCHRHEMELHIYDPPSSGGCTIM